MTNNVSAKESKQAHFPWPPVDDDDDDAVFSDADAAALAHALGPCGRLRRAGDALRSLAWRAS